MNGLRPPCDCCGPLHAFSKPSEGFGKKKCSRRRKIQCRKQNLRTFKLRLARRMNSYPTCYWQAARKNLLVVYEAFDEPEKAKGVLKKRR